MRQAKGKLKVSKRVYQIEIKYFRQSTLVQQVGGKGLKGASTRNFRQWLRFKNATGKGIISLHKSLMV